MAFNMKKRFLEKGQWRDITGLTQDGLVFKHKLHSVILLLSISLL